LRSAAIEETDEMLMAQVQKSDHAAFTLLLDRHLSSLRGFLYRLCGNRADAEEIAQETFLRVWREARRWQPDRVRFTTWLYRIGRNLSIDRLRKHRELGGDSVPEIANEQDGPLDDVERQRLRSRVSAAVAGLAERQRTALLLAHYQGMTNPQIAAVLQTSVEAVESLLARARRTLKDTLDADLDSTEIRP
jgi:RNA polymerase sigma-70 factor (ECF subfamily)